MSSADDIREEIRAEQDQLDFVNVTSFLKWIWSILFGVILGFSLYY